MDNGGFYEGEWKNGLRDGQGKQTWPDKSYYEGEWFEDKVIVLSKIFRLKVWENWFMSTEMFMKGIGRTIWLMEEVYIATVMVLNTMESGQMIYKMEKEQRYGLMVLNMKDHLKTGKKTEMEFYISQIITNIQDNFLIMRFQAGENIIGVMEKFIKENGKIIK